MSPVTVRRALGPILVAVALVGACGRSGGDALDRVAADAGADSGPAAIPTTTEPDLPLSPLAALVRPLASAEYDPSEHAAPVAPVRLTVENIGAEGVPVRAVGLQPSGEMEIPGESEVGWYRLSRTPGDPGSSVLAGHIAYNGRDGAFRHLADVDLGARIDVDLADGTSRTFRVVAVDQYRKDGLPPELFGSDGPPVLTLITCGGTFQPSLRSYDSNVVVTAVPA